MTILLDTPHGSQLYGLNHIHSDKDRYVVIDKRPTGIAKKHWMTQKIEGDQDVVTTDLVTFLRQCDSGIPQALEAMFSPKAKVDKIESLRLSYYTGLNMVVNTYSRTITNFVIDSVVSNNRFKLKRHALRLAINLGDLMSKGRFNSVLTTQQAVFISAMAAENTREYLNTMEALCPVDLGLDRLLGL